MLNLNSNRIGWAVVCVVLLPACGSTAPARLPDASLYRADLTEIVSSTAATGAVMVIDAPGIVDDRVISAGVTGDGRNMTSATPVRVASVTKTYVAAALLRLDETGQLDLDEPIGGLLSSDSLEQLKNGGHDGDRITVRHLITHTAGLPDHVSEQYLRAIIEDPSRHWTRDEQIAMLASGLNPVGAIGEKFHYSDTGYILLGEVIERRTGQALPDVVRTLLKFDTLGLENTWWELLETAPNDAPKRARQTFNNMDVTDWSATVDLFGGGGLVASADDMRVFFASLFDGAVFDQVETLESMLSSEGLPHDSPYRLGLFEYDVDGVTLYEHGGFWGTNVLHVPSLELTVSAVVLDQSGYASLRSLMHKVVTDYVRGQAESINE
ncbi:MAG: serine hydrolase domain-containing protein [Pseudomonadota bacterium]